MTTVSIIGAGEIGGAIAAALAHGGRIARVVLVDDAGAAAAGKALDIQQSGAIAGFHTRLQGTPDPARAIGSAVCVIADRFGPPSGEWRDDGGLQMLQRLLPDMGDAPLVFAGAQQAPLLLALAREAGVRRERLVGSAPDALAAAITGIVAMEARCAPGEVSLTVLGAPPSGFVVPWSEASIGGYALDRVLTQVQLARLEARAARLWPPGPFTLGLAAARIAEAVVRGSRRAHGVLTVLGGEFGVRNRIGTLPVLLSPSGIAHVRVPVLNTRERVRLENALSA